MKYILECLFRRHKLRAEYKKLIANQLNLLFNDLHQYPHMHEDPIQMFKFHQAVDAYYILDCMCPWCGGRLSLPWWNRSIIGCEQCDYAFQMEERLKWYEISLMKLNIANMLAIYLNEIIADNAQKLSQSICYLCNGQLETISHRDNDDEYTMRYLTRCNDCFTVLDEQIIGSFDLFLENVEHPSMLFVPLHKKPHQELRKLVCRVMGIKQFKEVKE